MNGLNGFNRFYLGPSVTLVPIIPALSKRMKLYFKAAMVDFVFSSASKTR